MNLSGSNLLYVHRSTKYVTRRQILHCVRLVTKSYSNEIKNVLQNFARVTLQLKRRTRRSQQSQECKDPCRQRLCDSWHRSLTFWPIINGFPWLTLEHFYIKFDDPSCIGFEKSRERNRHTDKRRWNLTIPSRMPSAWVNIPGGPKKWYLSYNLIHVREVSLFWPTL